MRNFPARAMYGNFSCCLRLRYAFCSGTAAIGFKRRLENVAEAELTDVSWRHLLGNDVAQDSSLETECLKKACVVGAGKLGSSLAESLVAKPGLAQVAVHMSVGGTDAKFEIMPVRLSKHYELKSVLMFLSRVCMSNSDRARISADP